MVERVGVWRQTWVSSRDTRASSLRDVDRAIQEGRVGRKPASRRRNRRRGLAPRLLRLPSFPLPSGTGSDSAVVGSAEALDHRNLDEAEFAEGQVALFVSAARETLARELLHQAVYPRRVGVGHGARRAFFRISEYHGAQPFTDGRFGVAILLPRE